MTQLPQDPRVPALDRIARAARAEADANAATLSLVTPQVAILTSQVESHDTRLDSLETDVAAAEGDITTLQADVSDAEAAISSIEADILLAEDDITDLRTDLTTAEGDITTLQAGLTAAEGDITSLEADLTAAEALITANAGDIAAATADISSLQGDLTAAESAIITNAGNITAIEAAIDGELFGDRASTGFPGSPTDGELAYSTSGEWAYWDAGRSRWLSLWKEDLSFADQVATSAFTFFKLQAIPTSTSFGHFWPFDVVITHGQAICANSITSATVVLLSASHPGGAAGMTFTSSNKAQVTGLNVLIPAGEVVSALTSATTAGATSCIWYARRAFTS